jgi:thiol-disulfide isomerase/thioredoxin
MSAGTDMRMEETAAPTADMMSEMPAPTETMMPHPGQEEMTATPDQGSAMSDNGSSMPGDNASEMMSTPNWFSTTLTDVVNSSPFTVNDFRGKVVLVETMAVWCPTCLQQQLQVKALRDSLGSRDDFVSIELDIDPNENQDMLHNYTLSNGFDWLYAVAPADVAHEIGELYGVQFLNPPSTPILVIDRHGVAHPLPFGLKSADQLQDAVETYLNEGM